MKNKNLSKCIFTGTLIIIVLGILFWFGFGLALLVIVGRFISPVLIVLLLVGILFFKQPKNNYFYWALSLNLLLGGLSIYLIKHALDNWQIL